MYIVIKKLIFPLTLFIFCSSIALADSTYFIDFSKVLNYSKAGAEAQKNLKNKFESETKKFKVEEKNIKKEESEIISQKKDITKEEYQKKVENLRKKVASLQKNKQDSLRNIAKKRNESKVALLKKVNPIIKKYMEDNQIRILVDKKGVVLGDVSLEVTDQIIAILNKELTSLN